MARSRTETRRQQIIETAAQAFLELGYDQTSMSLISQRLGGSKATLYGYFKSKEDLLLAVLDTNIERRADELMVAFRTAPDLRTGLERLGAGYLVRRLSAEPTRHFQMIASMAEPGKLGRIFYGNIIRPAWLRLCRLFEELMDEGRLRRGDSWAMAMHFKGLLDGDLVDQRLLGVIDGPDAATVRAASIAAVDVFLCAYGLEEANSERSPDNKPKSRAASRP